ncbi:hypothetical protein F5Y17DRAFT_134635 [Xylariaceae sp. FL0594]|nr:hypothetical protein F5Y17DRAFT_134635 [Xylariaceae sp. FL0594]
MPPMSCANAPSVARLFVQLCARRGASSSLSPFATISSPGSSILDVLLPPQTQARALSLSLGAAAARNSSSAIIPSTTTTTTRRRIEATKGNARQYAGATLRTFSTSQPLAKTVAIHNAQTDDEGNEMVLEITPRAANRLSQIMSKDKDPYLALRIQVESGGCHGFQYIMSLTTLPPTLSPSSSTTTPQQPLDPDQVASDVTPSTTTSNKPSPPSLGEDDTIFAFAPDSDSDTFSPPSVEGSPKIVLDTPSLELLKGSKVDYTMELIGSQFKIVDNPLATSSCGCGTSFDIKI